VEKRFPTASQNNSPGGEDASSKSAYHISHVTRNQTEVKREELCQSQLPDVLLHGYELLFGNYKWVTILSLNLKMNLKLKAKEYSQVQWFKTGSITATT